MTGPDLGHLDRGGGRAPGADARRSLRIGLTGPIGCGKSTVAASLARLGAAVVDADLLAREVTEPGSPALAAISARFGGDVIRPDGSLDREALGRRVFADPDELRALEAIIHPPVRPLILAALASAEARGAAVAVLEAIRLVDAGYGEIVDEVWLITCDGDDQRRRLADRGMGADDAERRIAAQEDLVARARAAATRIIDTSGSLADLDANVADALEDALTARANGRVERR